MGTQITTSGQDAEHEQIVGTVSRLRFQNPETGFFIAVLDHAEGGRFTIVGVHPAVFEGETMSCKGSFVMDPKYGRQFRAVSVEMLAPATERGLEKYLSETMHGIGKKIAGKLVKAFGERLPEIIENNPKLLLDVPGMNEKKLDALVSGWEEHAQERNTRVFLSDLGVGPATTNRIIKTFGTETVATVKADPYALIEFVPGFGFFNADKLAHETGIAHNSKKRIRSGVLHILNGMSGIGHCGCRREELVARSQELLRVEPDEIEPVIDDAIGRGDVIVRRGGRFEVEVVWKARLFAHELGVADHMRRLQGHPPAWGIINAKEAVASISRRSGIALGRDQKAALEMALSSPVSVVTGNPGTGKTSIVRFLIEDLEARKMQVALVAPTGKAARRLSESTLRKASTIHRLLEGGGDDGFRRNESSPILADVIIVDEASMVDAPLMHALLRAIKDGSSLVIVGDVDQLPSVGPGQILHDIITSETVPVTRLKEIFRQAAESRIITNAFRINMGEMPEFPASGEASDFYYMEAKDTQDAFHKVSDMVLKHIPRRFGYDPKSDIQVLAPMKSGPCGVNALNDGLQRALSTDALSIERYNTKFSMGDKVIQVANNYETGVFNGDMGYVVQVDAEKKRLRVEFDVGHVTYGFDDLEQLQLAYAMTIHRSQGSEFPAVVIPVLTSHFMMLQRNLIYTGITRGKKLVVLVGQMKALAMAVRNDTSGQRVTSLYDHLVT